jgi:hypothetical protein
MFAACLGQPRNRATAQLAAEFLPLGNIFPAAAMKFCVADIVLVGGAKKHTNHEPLGKRPEPHDFMLSTIQNQAQIPSIWRVSSGHMSKQCTQPLRT